MSTANHAFLKIKIKKIAVWFCLLSTPQFHCQGVWFLAHMHKKQTAQKWQSTAIHSVPICLTVWEIVFMHHFMCCLLYQFKNVINCKWWERVNFRIFSETLLHRKIWLDHGLQASSKNKCNESEQTSRTEFLFLFYAFSLLCIYIYIYIYIYTHCISQYVCYIISIFIYFLMQHPH